MRLHALGDPGTLNLNTPASLGLAGFATNAIAINGVAFTQYQSLAAIGGRTVYQAIVNQPGAYVPLPDIVHHYVAAIGGSDIDFVWSACRNYRMIRGG